MQVVPRNVTSWNAKHSGQAATWELLTGKATAAARKQIQLGVYILRGSISWLARYGFPWPASKLSDEQIKIGLMVYAWGPGNMKPYLDEIQATGTQPRAAEIRARWPDLGKPKNNPLRYSRRVWNNSFGAGDAGAPATKTKTQYVGWGVIAIAAVVANA